MYKRIISLELQSSPTFFLWGPRQSGKSSLLKTLFPNAFWVNLLDQKAWRKYSVAPETLRSEILAMELPYPLVVVDEVQKVPALLDEVHLMMEEHGIAFALCGSSARKLKRGHANLLGGRALRYQLYGLTFHELKEDFNLEKILNRGTLPKIYQSSDFERRLESYTTDYLKEEIAEEGLVRNLPAFSEFLSIAARTDSEILSYENIASACSVSAPTIKGYFQLLQDTLMGSLLPPFRKKPKRRTIQTPKFYFFDVGVVNALATRGKIVPKTDQYGKALENYIHHELKCYLDYNHIPQGLSYWRLSSGIEVDFVIGNPKIAIEITSQPKGKSKGLREFFKEYPEVGRSILVSTTVDRKQIHAFGEQKIEIYPIQLFLEELWKHKIVQKEK